MKKQKKSVKNLQLKKLPKRQAKTVKKASREIDIDKAEKKNAASGFESWILMKSMYFGVINKAFSKGTVFLVDRSSGKMRVQKTGEVFDNISDLDTARRIQGAIQPYNRELLESLEQEQGDLRREELSQERRSAERRQDVLSRVIHSDEDMIQAIDISHTRTASGRPKVENREQVTAPNHVSFIRKTQPKPVVIESYEGREVKRVISGGHIIADEELERYLGKQEKIKKSSYDVCEHGSKIQQRAASIRRNHDVIVTRSGQKVVRGMRVVRDDGLSGEGMGSGGTRNAGQEFVSREEREENLRARRDSVENRKREVVNGRGKKSRLANDDGRFIDLEDQDMAGIIEGQ